MNQKVSIISIIYGITLVLLAVFSMSIYLYNIINDEVAQLFIFNFFEHSNANFTAGNPMVALITGALGIITLLSSTSQSKLQKRCHYIGILPLLFFSFIWSIDLFNSIVPYSRPGESSGAEVYVALFILLILVITAIPLIISLFSILRNKKNLIILGCVFIVALILQIILSNATLPYSDAALFDSAIDQQDANICEGMLEGEGRYSCYQQVALETAKKEYCELIPATYTYPYFGQPNNYRRGQCLYAVQEILDNQKIENPLIFVSDHGFTIEFPEDWATYRYTVVDERVTVAPKYMPAEYPNGFITTKYSFGIGAQDSVISIVIYGKEHWDLGIAGGGRGRVLGEKDGFVYTGGGSSQPRNVPQYQADDIDDIVNSFKLIEN